MCVLITGLRLLVLGCWVRGDISWIQLCVGVRVSDATIVCAYLCGYRYQWSGTVVCVGAVTGNYSPM